MLTITTEYRHGILFVRLHGYLISSTVSRLNKEVDSWLLGGITNIVFNVVEVEQIDNSGNDALLHYYQLLNNNDGHSLICGINNHINNNLKKSGLLKYVYEISDELNAIKVMKWKDEARRTNC